MLSEWQIDDDNSNVVVKPEKTILRITIRKGQPDAMTFIFKAEKDLVRSFVAMAKRSLSESYWNTSLEIYPAGIRISLVQHRQGKVSLSLQPAFVVPVQDRWFPVNIQLNSEQVKDLIEMLENIKSNE